ncbi:hypothetical protein VB711_02830 [Cronbergia sp. UHCC 0137]|uniref:hypothetical protein n=1 Tax=Cronbergia sp. UHCC 0137 TaxID=3110239 RepID=UPI002B21DD51|nr:hypothetical protein [Cronbergia sp. UHCC 0137]MEA5616776.1 hypothetical protein [Cronbergia sp. UHCC 0137]
MFGFIKNLIGGIFGFITGLFGKKDNSYYLELKEDGTEKTPTPTTITKVAEPVAAANPANVTKPEPAKVSPKTEATFAPKYLSPSVTTSNGRRRPGANMDIYLDMARQVKTPG